MYMRLSIIKEVLIWVNAYGGGFALIVVLFILLIIVGASWSVKTLNSVIEKKSGEKYSHRFFSNFNVNKIST